MISSVSGFVAGVLTGLYLSSIYGDQLSASLRQAVEQQKACARRMLEERERQQAALAEQIQEYNERMKQVRYWLDHQVEHPCHIPKDYLLNLLYKYCGFSPPIPGDRL